MKDRDLRDLPDGTPLLGQSEKKLVPSGAAGLWFYFRIASFWFGYACLASLASVVWPSQIEALVGSEYKELWNGIVPAFGAFASLLITPIAGMLSDRSTSPLGRRRVFILTGVIIGSVFLAGMGYFKADRGNLWVFIIFTVGYQFGTNWAAGPYAGLIPDLVHPSQIGTASGYNGLAQVFGYLVGLIGAGVLTMPSNYFFVYAFLLGLYVTFSMPTIFGIKEPRRIIENQKPLTFRMILKSFYLDPKIYKSFYWVIATRGMEQMGYYTIMPFLQFFLQDIADVEDPTLWASILFGCIVIVSVPSSVIAGRLSDRYGKKLFVMISTSLMAAVLLTLGWTVYYPKLFLLFICSTLFGVGYGAFLAVDWALALAVLPEGADTAKDMGIWHIAFVFPQILAPLIAGSILDLMKMNSLQHAYTALFGVGFLWFFLSAVFVTQVKVPSEDNRKLAAI